MGNNTNQSPCIQTAGMTEKDLCVWLSKLASDAQRAGQDYSMVLHELKSAEASLRYVEKDIHLRINYLASEQIIRSADQSSAVQEDLNGLRVIHVAVRGMQQTTLALIDQLHQSSHKSADQDREVHHQVCAEQVSGTASTDR